VEVALGAYTPSGLALREARGELQLERDLSVTTVFSVVFALPECSDAGTKLPELTLSSLNLNTRTTRFDLELYLWECSDDFRELMGRKDKFSAGGWGVMVYSTDLFEEA